MAEQVLRECNVPVRAVVGTDSSAARGIAHRHGSQRVRHLRIQDPWIQERVREKDLEVRKLDTNWNRADIGTKYLERGRIALLLKHMGLFPRGQVDRALRATSWSAAVVASVLAAMLRICQGALQAAGASAASEYEYYYTSAAGTGASEASPGVYGSGILVVLTMLAALIPVVIFPE